jgi:hypothetical protein
LYPTREGIRYLILFILVEKPEVKKSLGRLKRRWEDNIKIDRRENGVIWTGMIWLRTRAIGRLL